MRSWFWPTSHVPGGTTQGDHTYQGSQCTRGNHTHQRATRTKGPFISGEPRATTSHASYYKCYCMSRNFVVRNTSIYPIKNYDLTMTWSFWCYFEKQTDYVPRWLGMQLRYLLISFVVNWLHSNLFNFHF